MSLIVQASQLSKVYHEAERRVEVLRSLDFSMQAGDFVSIRGASGAGKSTFLNLLAALDRPSSGEITVAGENLNDYIRQNRIHLFRRKMIGFVFQNHYLMPDFSVLENVMMPLLIQKVSHKTAREKALAVLERLGLAGRQKHYPSQISGGESQRVAVGRAIVHRPPLVLADEPTGNLDSANRRLFIDLLSALQKEDNLTILVVTHEEDLATAASRQLLMQDGRLYE